METFTLKLYKKDITKMICHDGSTTFLRGFQKEGTYRSHRTGRNYGQHQLPQRWAPP